MAVGVVSMYLRQQLLSSYFQRDLLTPADQLYLALCAVPAAINATGSSITEPTAAAYARASVLMDSEHWGLTDYGEAYNLQDIAFPGPALEDWGYLGAWALLDSVAGGMVLASAPLVEPLLYTAELPAIAVPPQGIMLRLRD